MRKETILIIVNKEGTRTALASVLSQEGYEVLAAQSGREGLEVLHKAQPPLAIIDAVMPGMDGIETLRKFKEFRPETQVIMISSKHCDVETVVQTIKMGAFDFLLIPPSLAGLLNTIERALKNRVG